MIERIFYALVFTFAIIGIYVCVWFGVYLLYNKQINYLFYDAWCFVVGVMDKAIKKILFVGE